MHELPVPEQEEVVSGLMAVDDAIFTDRSRQKTSEKLQGKHSDETWIMLLRDGKKIVGYNCILIHHLQHEGKWISCWNSRAAVLPLYRGENKTGKFSLNHFFRFRRRFPFRKIYGIVALVHPSSFFLFAKKVPSLYPYPKTTLTAKEQAIFDHLHEFLRLEPVEGKPAFVAPHGTNTQTSPVEQDFWRRNPDPSLAFFHQYNAEYLDGRAIMGFFEISLSMMVSTALLLFKSKGGLKTIFPFLSPKPGKKEKIERLKRLPVFRDVSEQSLRKLEERLVTRRLKPGEFLFKEGDQERAMYLILKGAMYVILNTENGELVVSQLQVGDFVGEFGLLYNLPRNASLKSFRNVELLRISDNDIQFLRDLEPGIGKEIYRTVGIRMADNWLRFDPGYTHLGHSGRLAFIRDLPTQNLEKGAQLQKEAPSRCILMEGTITVGKEHFEAPDQLLLPANSTLQAINSASIMLIPTSTLQRPKD